MFAREFAWAGIVLALTPADQLFGFPPMIPVTSSPTTVDPPVSVPSKLVVPAPKTLIQFVGVVCQGVPKSTPIRCAGALVPKRVANKIVHTAKKFFMIKPFFENCQIWIYAQ